MMFATFNKRISDTRVEIDFTYWRGTITLIVDKRLTKTVSFKSYTDELWNSFDFETMNEYPCIFSGYTTSKIATVFQCCVDPECASDICRKEIQQSIDDKSETFFCSETSKHWISLCNKYNNNLQRYIDSYVVNKLKHLNSDKNNGIVLLNNLKNKLLSIKERLNDSEINDAISILQTYIDSL